MSFDLNVYLADLKTLCAIDSGHFNAPGAEAMADFFETRYRALGLNVERRHYDNNDFAPFLLAENGPADEPIDFLMIAHMDTVFPVGEGAARPFEVDADGIGRGPGCIDCKGGTLLIYYLIRDMLSENQVHFHFAVALNSDEERGSKYSRPYFEQLAQRTKTCFVFEPGRANDEFVSQRKSGANYLVRVHGVAAHSGVNPQDGASAIVELAKWIPEMQSLNDYEGGCSLNIGRIDGGGNNGAVPDYCECTISYRCLTEAQMQKLPRLFERMKTSPFDSRTSIEVEQVSLRPAMSIHPSTARLLEALASAGEKENLPVTHITTGGGSDGNFIAHYGVATLDGCGPCGAKLHTRDEYLKTQSVERRYRLMKRLMCDMSK